MEKFLLNIRRKITRNLLQIDFYKKICYNIYIRLREELFMKFENKVMIQMMRNRRSLLMARDPVANEKICKKIDRRIRALEKQN